MRVHLVSNPPWAFSGYGVQCALLIRQLLAAGHEVFVQADTMPFGTVLTWEGVQVAPGFYPGADQRTDMTGYYAERFGSDVVIILLDVFVLNASSGDFAGLECPAAWWVPVDSMPLGFPTGAFLQASGTRPLAMSRFGEHVLRRAEFRDVLHVPHAVDTAVFTPQSEAVRKQARIDLEIGPETFVIGINAANQHPVRKGWFEQLYAFQVFHAQHPDSVLVAWTLKDGRPVGLALDALTAMLGLSDCVLFRHPGDVAAGVTTPGQLASKFYAACDVVSNCSWAEGFGIVPLEAQACGVPAIVTDFSAMAEVAAPGEFGAWKIPSSPVLAQEHVAALWGRPRMDMIGMAYEQAFAERESGVLALRGAAGRQHALAYDHQSVFDLYWRYILDELSKGKPGGGTAP